MENMEDKVFMDSIVKFMKAQQEAEKAGKDVFTCPVCGGEARWSRSSYNNHLHCGCKKCNTGIME